MGSGDATTEGVEVRVGGLLYCCWFPEFIRRATKKRKPSKLHSYNRELLHIGNGITFESALLLRAGDRVGAARGEGGMPQNSHNCELLRDEERREARLWE